MPQLRTYIFAFLLIVLCSSTSAQEMPKVDDGWKFIEGASDESPREAMTELIMASVQNMLNGMSPRIGGQSAFRGSETTEMVDGSITFSPFKALSLSTDAPVAMRAVKGLGTAMDLAKLLIPLLPFLIPGAAVLGKLALLFVVAVPAKKLFKLLPIAKVLGKVYGLKLKVLGIGALIGFKILAVKLSLMLILLAGPLFLLKLNPLLLAGKLVPLTLMGLMKFLDCSLLAGGGKLALAATLAHADGHGHDGHGNSCNSREAPTSQLNLISQALMDAFSFQRERQRSTGIIPRSDDLSNLMLGLQGFEAVQMEYQEYVEMAQNEAPELLEVPLIDLVDASPELKRLARTSANKVWRSTPGIADMEFPGDFVVEGADDEGVIGVQEVEYGMSLLTESISNYEA